MGVASREMEVLESPDSSLASSDKILAGEPAEFLDKVTNPKVEGPRGGASIYDKVKWKGRVVYLARPGLGYVSVLR